MDKLPDAAIVAQVRELVQSPFIRAALLRSSDTFLAFVWRKVEFVVADQSQTDRQIIARLWDVLHDPHLNQVPAGNQPRTDRVDDARERDRYGSGTSSTPRIIGTQVPPI